MGVLDWLADLSPADWDASLVAFLAVVMAGGSLRYTKKSANAAEKSATEAGRAATATERQAEASERQAAAAEATLAAGAMPTALSTVTPNPDPVEWRLTKVNKTTYRLRNVGAQSASAVAVRGLPADAAGLVRCKGSEMVESGHALDVAVLSVWGPRVDALEVKWGESESAILPLED